MKDTTALDASMPPRIWLQIDTAGDNDADRDEPFPAENLSEVSWHWEQIGGVEVEYVRADLVRAAMPINANDPDDPELCALAELLGMTANILQKPPMNMPTPCSLSAITPDHQSGHKHH